MNIKFLQVYKEYEQILRNHNIDIKNYEESASADIQDKLRICRQMRNYLCHSAEPDLLTISKEQIEFIQDLIQIELDKEDIAKKHIKTVNTSICKSSDKCIDALNKMIKLKQTQLAIMNVKTNQIGIVDIYKVSAAILQSKTSKLSDIKTTKNYIFVSPLDNISDIRPYINNNVILCTDNGQDTGKLKGTIII